MAAESRFWNESVCGGDSGGKATADHRRHGDQRGSAWQSAARQKQAAASAGLGPGQGRRADDGFREGLKGTVVPFAGYKGSAIAMVIDVLTRCCRDRCMAHVRDLYTDFDEPACISHVFAR